MRVAVVDVGSNTARLLVAERGRRGLAPVAEAKAYLRLGAEILEHGVVSPAKLQETADELRRFARTAREAGAVAADVFVTAPGRQAANGDELVAEVARASGHVARVLSAEEEGVLAFEGALASTDVDGTVAVCDVGGGSTELVVGDRDRGAVWTRSIDVGSLRLTTQFLRSDPPSRAELEEAKRYVEEQVERLAPPPVDRALAVGGSARAIARLTSTPLTIESLSEGVAFASARRSDKLARREDVDEARARTLAGGSLILREVARLLDRPLELGRGGLREGAAARLLAQRAAA